MTVYPPALMFDRKPLPVVRPEDSWAEFCRTVVERIDEMRLAEADCRCPTCGTDVPHVKWCWACRRTLSVEAFNRNRNKPSGRRSECRTCQAAREMRRYARHALAAIRRSA